MATRRFCEICARVDHKTAEHKCEICGANDHMAVDDAFHPITCTLCFTVHMKHPLFNRRHTNAEHECTTCGLVGVEQSKGAHRCEYCYKCGKYGHSDTSHQCILCISLDHKTIDHPCPLDEKGECKIANSDGKLGRGHGIEVHQCKFCKSMEHSSQDHRCGFKDCTMVNDAGVAGRGHGYETHLCYYCKTNLHDTSNHKCQMCGKLGHCVGNHCNCDSKELGKDYCGLIGCDKICDLCRGINHECEDLVEYPQPSNLKEAIDELARLRFTVTQLTKAVAELRK